MAPTRPLRLWGLAVSALCLLALAGTDPNGRPAAAAEPATSAAASLLAPAVDAAVLPARPASEVRAAGTGADPRTGVLGAVLAGLLGLPALFRRTSAASGRGRPPLRTRRHTIALRAPPLRFA